MHLSLGHRKQSEEDIRCFEDALTSSFFGTLRYLPSWVTVDLLKRLPIPSLLEKIDLLVDPVVEFEFWPNIAASGRIEPDLKIVVKPRTEGPSIKILVECKWNSPASDKTQSSNEEGNATSEPCTQLFKQWNSLTEEGRSKYFHIYLVKNVEKAKSESDKSIDEARSKKGTAYASNWEERLGLISWLEILKTLNALDDMHKQDNSKLPSVLQWKIDMVAMFDRLGVREHKFKGFKEVQMEVESHPLEYLGSPLFWKGFKGFIHLEDVLIPKVSCTEIFFSNENVMKEK